MELSRSTPLLVAQFIEAVLILAELLLIICCGCDVQRRKSDAELGLNPQQAAGRRTLRSILRSLP